MSKPKRSQKGDNGSLHSPSSFITHSVAGTNPETLPFQEWSDQDVKSEKFDFSQKDKKLGSLPSELENYEDAQDVKLPPSLWAKEWKKPQDIFPKAHFAVFVNKTTFPDLVSANSHILDSEFARHFISSIWTLLYLGNVNVFPVEFSSPTCSPPENAWRPWHHIYSNSSIMRGQEHTPTLSPSGKYLIRLFWMGSWKKVYVDDTFPVDRENRLLLPSLPVPEFSKSETSVVVTKKGQKPTKTAGKKGADDKTVELWPMLLSKALLKVASLSWYYSNEIEDFDVIQCLTGWIPQKIPTKGLELADIWDITSGYSNNFKWPNDGTYSMDTKTTKSQKTKSTKGSKKVALAKLDEDTLGHPVVAICDDLSNENVSQMSPCLSHSFLIQETRDIPLVKPLPDPEIAFWKRDRWVPWAREKGIIPPEVIPSKNFKIVSPLRCDGEIVGPEYEGNVEPEGTKAAKEKPKKGKQKTDVKLEPDPSIWLEYQNIAPYINTLIIYLAPSRFKYKTKISDVSDERASQTKDSWKSMVTNLLLKGQRNEPFYFFAESIDNKLLLLNISQAGNVENLEKVHREITTSIESDQTEIDFCEQILRKNLKKNSLLQKLSHQESSTDCIETCRYTRKPAVLILENYVWNRNDFGENVTMVKTFGSKSMLLELKPGRNTFTIYLDSLNSFVVQILSDTPFDVSYLEEYLTNISNESQNLMNASMELASNYGKLVQSFGMEEFKDNLKFFYLSYKPNGFLPKKELKIIHDVFFDKFYDILDEVFESDEIKRAADILFLNIRTFDSINIYDYLEETPHLDSNICYEEQCLMFIKSMHRAATTVQAFFKGVYVRSLFKRHQQNNKLYMPTFDRLKKVYTDIFSSSKRSVFVPNLFRSFFEDSRMEHLLPKYDIVEQLENVINLQKVQGTVVVQKNAWTPICRYSFYVNSSRPIDIKINLFCDLKYYIRVFHNGTSKEIKRYTNNVAVDKYDSNEEGYTILCYGFSEVDDKKNWKLTVASRKRSKENLLLNVKNDINVLVLKDNYIPNEKNLICRYFVSVQFDSVTLTTRLCTSFEHVDILLRMLLPNGRKLAEISGKGSIILPIALLKVEERRQRSQSLTIKKKPKNPKRSSGQSDKGSTSDKLSVRSLDSREKAKYKKRLSAQSEALGETYIIEAYVADDSWPLNGEEWRNVDNFRQRKLLGPDATQTSSNNLLAPRRKSSVKSIEKPHWAMQALCETGDVIQFTKDGRTDEEIRKEKGKWYEEDSGRYRRSHEIRQAYLKENLEDRTSFEMVDQKYRSNTPDMFKPQKLKVPDFDKFYTKKLEEVDFDEREVKTQEDLVEEEKRDLEKQEEFEEFQTAFFEDMENLLKRQKENFELWNNWFDDIRSESVEMLEEANELKTKYISEVLESLQKEKKGKKDDKKGKPKGKGKKK